LPWSDRPRPCFRGNESNLAARNRHAFLGLMRQKTDGARLSLVEGLAPGKRYCFEVFGLRSVRPRSAQQQGLPVSSLEISHKQFCVTKADRSPPSPQKATWTRQQQRARSADVWLRGKRRRHMEEFAISLAPLTETPARNFPCAHDFHAACVEEVRKFGVKKVCIMYRTE
jgi:hypothetical protein